MKIMLAALALMLLANAAHAQTPNVSVQWPPNPATDNVQGYWLYIDLAPPQLVAPVLDASCNCIQAKVTLAKGSHSLYVTAFNVKLTDDPSNPSGSVVGTQQESDPSALIKFTVNNKPVKVGSQFVK